MYFTERWESQPWSDSKFVGLVTIIAVLHVVHAKVRERYNKTTTNCVLCEVRAEPEETLVLKTKQFITEHITQRT
jgi:hypothetical protein